jgi:hypothetical protein
VQNLIDPQAMIGILLMVFSLAGRAPGAAAHAAAFKCSDAQQVSVDAPARPPQAALKRCKESKN